MTIDEKVERYRLFGDSAFQPICDHFFSTCRSWHRNLSKRIEIDFEDFHSRFNYLLHRTLNSFDPLRESKHGESGKFLRYFMSSLRRACNSLKRKYLAKKNEINRKAVSFHSVGMIIDARSGEPQEIIDVSDSLGRLVKSAIDRNILIMLTAGYMIAEICAKLSITRRQYWTRIYSLRKDPYLQREFCKN